MEKMSFSEILVKYLELMNRIDSGECDINLLKNIASGYRAAVLEFCTDESLKALEEFIYDK